MLAARSGSLLWKDPWSLISIPGIVFIALGFGSALAFTVVRSLTDPGPQNYFRILQGASFHALLTTFKASAITAVVVLAMGYAYAYAMRVGPKPLRIYLMLFLAVQFATSSIARAYSWVQLLQTNGVVNKLLMSAGVIDSPLKLMRNDLGAIIGTSHVLLPHMVLILYASMQQVDLATVSAARSLGASAPRAFFSVFVPATKVGILSGLALTFILGLSFYATPALLGNPSGQMISAMIMTQAEYGNFGAASTLSITLVFITLLGLFLTSLFLRRYRSVGSR
ncbi:ABC transporter permease [Phyllobacterium sp. 0TCS1.6C]|uniref:ABC transporter permease n=1 Tax=unclassified Phyllobacterium TaxID=2638441 RepID=UPI002264BDB0|nr:MULTISPECIES: ABC transporter permease [unclassified Phyllobacterium]MCX8279063.1 ABC transporter permease [Phyllobacterium sp. 0TCS1.6C]MCX8293847.1 ABC transporter permease [Phyllobacterium sp. 0TCS1.6A]